MRPMAKRMKASLHQARCAVWIGGALLVGALGVSAFALVPATVVDPELRETPVRVVSVEQDAVALYDQAGVLRHWPTSRIVRLTFATPQAAAKPPAASADSAALQAQRRQAERLGESALAQRLGAMFEALQPAARGAQAEADASGWMLTLTDGQTWRGAPTTDPADAAPESLCWSHPTLGNVRVALERVRSLRRFEDAGQAAPGLRMRPWAPAAALPAGDTATLRNGDTLNGFVANADAHGITLETDTGDVPLVWDALAAVTLSNPPQTHPTPRDTLALRDGSRVHVRSPRLDDATLEVTPTLLAETLGLPMESHTDGDARRRLPIDHADSLDFAASGRRLLQLTELTPRVTGGEALGLSYEPRLTTPAEGEIQAWIHAPTTLRFDLPSTAEYVAGTAALALPPRLPPEVSALAGADVAIRHDGGEAFARSLRNDRPFPFHAPVAGDTLEIVVTPGPDGSALGRVRFDDLRVLLKTGR